MKKSNFHGNMYFLCNLFIYFGKKEDKSVEINNVELICAREAMR